MKAYFQKIILPILMSCVFLICGIACSAQNAPSTIQYIKHGTSFGMCHGYCFNETKFDSSLIISVRKAWRQELPALSDTLPANYETWLAMADAADLNTFFTLPKRIGCPDCNDGGAEWIEISTGNKVYMVTFECGKGIDGLQELLTILRRKK